MNTELPAIFTECCDKHIKQFDLSRPFVCDGWVYATDARIIVRCPANGFQLPEEPTRKLPKIETILSSVDTGIERKTVPIPDCRPDMPCEWCKGTGLISTGRVECDSCGQFYEIKRNGQPVPFDCDQCEGTGRQPNDEAILVRDSPPYYLSAKYVGLLRKHGVTEVMVPLKDVRPPDKRQRGFPEDAATFTGPGFDGWLMPLDTASVERDKKAGRK